MSEQNTPPTIDLDADISHLNLGHPTLRALHESETNIRNQVRNPTAPETYSHDNLVKEFGDVVTASRDSAEHEAEVQFCRSNNYTQAQFDAHFRQFYGSGRAAFEQQQQAIDARDDQLINYFNGEENAKIVYNRVAQMGLDPDTLSFEQMVAQHNAWQKLNPNEQQINVPTQAGDQPDQNTNTPAAGGRPDLTVTDPKTGTSYTMDITDMDSINKFSAQTFTEGKRTIKITQKFPNAQAMIDKAIKEHAEYLHATASEKRRQLGL